MKIDFQTVHFTADSKLIDFIKGKLAKLDKFNSRIIDISVVMKLENAGQVKDKIVEILLNVPGNSLVSKSSSKSFEQSADEAIDQVARQLKKWKAKQGGR